MEAMQLDLPLNQSADVWGGRQARYVQYCIANQYPSPNAALDADRKKWPGGVMCGFILWIGERWQEWRKENNVGRDTGLTQAQHAAFDKWLEARVETIAALTKANA